MLTWMLLAACGTDADFDGFPRSEDCDDNDPFVYPGAPDDPADGLDADCDGVDPDHAFIGGWELVDLTAVFSSYSLLVEDSAEGDMRIGDDFASDMELTATINPDFTDGVALPIELSMLGDASPLDGPGLTAVYLVGEAYGETAVMSLECGTEDGLEMQCDGTMQAFGIGLSAAAVFDAQ